MFVCLFGDLKKNWFGLFLEEFVLDEEIILYVKYQMILTPIGFLFEWLHFECHLYFVTIFSLHILE